MQPMFHCICGLCLRSNFGFKACLRASHVRACSHAMTCSSVCDWQAVGWLKRAVSPAVCSQLHMRGASGERLVDLLLVVTFPHRDWQAKPSYSNFTRTHLLTEAECNINFVLCVGKGRTLKWLTLELIHIDRNSQRCLHFYLHAQHHG